MCVCRGRYSRLFVLNSSYNVGVPQRVELATAVVQHAGKPAVEALRGETKPIVHAFFINTGVD